MESIVGQSSTSPLHTSVCEFARLTVMNLIGEVWRTFGPGVLKSEKGMRVMANVCNTYFNECLRQLDENDSDTYLEKHFGAMRDAMKIANVQLHNYDLVQLCLETTLWLLSHMDIADVISTDFARTKEAVAAHLTALIGKKQQLEFTSCTEVHNYTQPAFSVTSIRFAQGSRGETRIDNWWE